MFIWPFSIPQTPSPHSQQAERGTVKVEKTPDERAENQRRLTLILQDGSLWETAFAKEEREFLKRLGLTYDEQEDVLQDIYIAAMKNQAAGKYDGNAKPKYYLHAIARNHANDVIAGNIKERRRQVSFDTPLDPSDPGSGTVGGTISAPDASPVEPILMEEMEAEWRGGLDEIHQRIDAEKNEKHRLIMHFLFDVQARADNEKDAYAAIAQSAMEQGIDLPYAHVPPNVQRAKIKAEQIVLDVAEAHGLGDLFIQAASHALHLRPRKK